MKTVLAEGKYLRLVKEDRWEYVERTKASGAVCVIAVTPEQNVLIVEQHRMALGKTVLELPAGLAGDTEADHGEQLATAADRELLEETGYRAGTMEFLMEGPTTPGLTSEIISFFKATNLVREHAGGGDQTEAITLHEVPLKAIQAWLAQKAQEGMTIDPKIYAGLYFCK